jgi:Tfp pilus assembly protein PilV
MFLKDSRGFAFIDFIIGIVIIGIAVLPIIGIISAVSTDNNQVLLHSRGNTYANSIMNHIRANSFDENSAWPWSASLGSDGGDSDDIDDYIAADWSSIIPGFSDFSAAASVNYIDPSISLNWITPVAYITNYKLIVVTVSHTNMNVPITYSSIMTPIGWY